MASNVLSLTGDALAITDIAAVARNNQKLQLAPAAIKKMTAARRVVERHLADGQAHYGINTGFGSLAKKRIAQDDLETLQRNLVRSHSAGVGEPLPRDVTRAMMLCLAASLCRGYSGVRPELVELLVGMLNKGVTPVVPSLGSVGASGDLAPLAAVALAMIGEGTCELNGRVMSSSKALAAARLKPATLKAKEGLALINGTHLMCGWGALLASDAHTLHDAAVVALATSIDACRASHSFLDPRLYAARNQYAQGLSVARRLGDLLTGSAIRDSHVENDPRVQDPYSLRAAPTVLGAVDEALGQFADAISLELGAVTDNPLVFARGSEFEIGHANFRIDRGEFTCDTETAVSDEDAIVSGANFHGMPLAIPLDCLAIAIFHIAGISERRSYLMTGAFEPESHLKPFLTPQPGLSSGLMIAQYTAAACVNEMATLATPASVVQLSTCAGMEDYNSFGPRGAAKAARAIDLARKVVAVELLCAAQGVETHRPLKSGRGVEFAVKLVRSAVAPLTDDRPLTENIESIATLIAEGRFTCAFDESADEPKKRKGRPKK
ncbi:MAG: histidine ammonia-lyase [Phycisphaerales bacterium]